MSNNSPNEDDAVSSESFEQWLEQAADSKGVSKQNLMDQMLSSYWILDELTGLVGETEGMKRKNTGRGHQPSSSISASEGEDDVGNESKREYVGNEPESDHTSSRSSPDDMDERSTEASGRSDESTEESIKAIQTAIRELVENQPADERVRSETASKHPANSNEEGVVTVVSDLQRQIGRFEAKLNDLEERQDTQFNRLSDELQLLLDRVSEIEIDRGRFAEEEDLEALADSVHNLDERTRELQAQNNEFEGRIDREFDSIEGLFRRILNAIDEIESELESTNESCRNEIAPIKQRETEREQFREFKNEALRREIRRGSCESCGHGVDLAMLESLSCPNCKAQYTGIDDSGWNPFKSPTLETKPIDEP